MRKWQTWSIAGGLMLLGFAVFLWQGWRQALIFPWFSFGAQLNVALSAMNWTDVLRWCIAWPLLANAANQFLEE